ncbi:hypothetical protein SASC598P14_001960, partial [Snodgrassella alvi SCGC AB-598-P14]
IQPAVAGEILINPDIAVAAEQIQAETGSAR